MKKLKRGTKLQKRKLDGNQEYSFLYKYTLLGKKFSAPRILKMYHTPPPSVNFIISKAHDSDLFIDKFIL